MRPRAVIAAARESCLCGKKVAMSLLSDAELRKRLTGRVAKPHIDLAVEVNRECREKGIRIDPKRPQNLSEMDVSLLCDVLNKTREAVLRALAHVVAAMKAPGRAKPGE